MTDLKEYSAEKITVLEGLDAVRKKFDIVELTKRAKKRGDSLILSKELKIKYSSLRHAVEECRILSFFPNVHKSKVNALSRLKTNRELKKFADLYAINNLQVRQLYKLVKKWNKDIQKNPFLFISEDEHDLIMGSLLGDASIRQRDRNCCFRVAHSLKQKEYINWKLDKLKLFNISEFVERKKIINNRELNIIELSTKTHPVFNYYRNLFYKEDRKIIRNEMLEQLNPFSLAIWICDDGSYETKQGYIILCTNAFSLEEHNSMKKFFNSKFGLDPTIGFRDNKYYYLRFKQNDSKKLIEIVKPFIPPSMIYKIGEKNNG